MLAAMEARSCPNCGISVPVGYARCPRCRSSVSTAPPMGETSSAPRHSEGGSSAAPNGRNRPSPSSPYVDARARRVSAPPSGTAVERAGPPPRVFWVIGAVAAALGVSLAVLLARGESQATTAEEPPPREPSPEVTTPFIDETPIVTAPVAPEVPQLAKVSQATAVEQLRRTFGKARLYSQISTVGDQLELRSAACDDQQLRDLLDQARTTLTESGLHRVRCLLPHGQVVFAREL